MSRFELYGGINCGDCEYYRKSTRCPHMRCDHEDNFDREWLGMRIYKDRPHNINWDNKCKKFKEKNNE
jgi:hypothetical protein